MKALFTDAPGGWEKTSVTDVPDPVPRAGEVIVDIKAVGLNPADYFQVQGQYPSQPKAPFIIGRDAAGIVAAPGSKRWPTGTPVLAIQSQTRNLAEGTLCEKQRFLEHDLAPIPAGWTMDQAAAAPLAYMTAWRALAVCASCQPGSTVLVTGASGGVGVAGVQLALGLGATVVALSRSEEKQAKLKKMGVAFAFHPDDADLKKKIPQAIDKPGVDIVLETVGGPFIRTALTLLAPHGVVGVVGVLAGTDGTVSIPSLMFKRATIKGILVSDYTPAEAGDHWKRIVETLDKKGFKPVIDSTYPLADYAQAVDRLKGSPFGKVVIHPADK